MPPEHEFTQGIRMGAIAIVSAVVTATLVIGAGRALMPRAQEVQAHEVQTASAVQVPVVRTASLP